MSAFRTISGGNASSTGGGAGFLVGLDPQERPPAAMMKAVAAHPADALFFAGSGSARAVPVACFFDYYCPYCRVLSGHRQPRRNSEVVVSRHHWSIFGEPSELAARASLAAEQQGGGAACHAEILGTSIRVTPAYLRDMAEDLGLSWPRLERTVAGSAVTAALHRSQALAHLFAFLGTPDLVVGRTVVEGEISETRLRDLVRYEREDGSAPVSS